ncbi:16S rRNA (uracil(1498)-N(3))-methyltransferase [Fundicoccus culcitae]|uniref:Ribosomal RNA small subunit methyltransferase E n=1 Tax=Fundicoccus culcitae TaxID=2969821 RepID=A0ABY5P6G4_9LACT|nr:16S rRNA (uracil(1498)-N(3))-methyltransferase [Fundicoccus culcitae]UUX34328.1 16S rRNA (uracil(1498)-N(3))-methyltransferase [Fundicoccus culcitae]
MQRYFVEIPKITIGDTLTLNQNDSHHLIRVMRAKLNTEILVVDSQQQVFIAAFIRANDQQLAEVKVLTAYQQSVEMPVAVTIACGLSKHDKIDTIVQKGTECGMDAFIPLALDRDVVQWTHNKSLAKIERLKKIAKEAAEQSHRQKIPEIKDLMNLNQLFEICWQYDYLLVAYEETARSTEQSQLSQVFNQLERGKRILIVFGSEGGLTANEITLLEANGFTACSLGPRILRAETAPIFFLSALSYKIEIENKI